MITSSFHNVTKHILKPIEIHKMQDGTIYECRDLEIETEKGERITITLFLK